MWLALEKVEQDVQWCCQTFVKERKRRGNLNNQSKETTRNYYEGFQIT